MSEKLDKRRRARLREIAAQFNTSVSSAVDLLDHLKCIKADGVRQEIICVQNNQGPVAGNRKLCSTLPGHTRWYEQLLVGLDEVGADGIAELLRHDAKGVSLEHPAGTPTVHPRLPPGSPDHNSALQRTPPDQVVESVTLQTPVAALPVGVKNALAILDVSDEPAKNWRHLAEHLGISWEDSQYLEKAPHPTSKVIEIWASKHPQVATLGHLLHVLRHLERLDVIQKIKEVTGLSSHEGVQATPSMRGATPSHDLQGMIHSMEKSRRYNNNLGVSEGSQAEGEPVATKRSLAVKPLNNNRAAETPSQHRLHELDQFEKLSKFNNMEEDKTSADQVKKSPLIVVPSCSSTPGDPVRKSPLRVTSSYPSPPEDDIRKMKPSSRSKREAGDSPPWMNNRHGVAQSNQHTEGGDPNPFLAPLGAESSRESRKRFDDRRGDRWNSPREKNLTPAAPPDGNENDLQHVANSHRSQDRRGDPGKASSRRYDNGQGGLSQDQGLVEGATWMGQSKCSDLGETRMIRDGMHDGARGATSERTNPGPTDVMGLPVHLPRQYPSQPGLTNDDGYSSPEGTGIHADNSALDDDSGIGVGSHSGTVRSPNNGDLRSGSIGQTRGRERHNNLNSVGRDDKAYGSPRVSRVEPEFGANDLQGAPVVLGSSPGTTPDRQQSRSTNISPEELDKSKPQQRAVRKPGSVVDCGGHEVQSDRFNGMVVRSNLKYALEEGGNISPSPPRSLSTLQVHTEGVTIEMSDFHHSTVHQDMAIAGSVLDPAGAVDVTDAGNEALLVLPPNTSGGKMGTPDGVKAQAEHLQGGRPTRNELMKADEKEHPQVRNESLVDRGNNATDDCKSQAGQALRSAVREPLYRGHPPEIINQQQDGVPGAAENIGAVAAKHQDGGARLKLFLQDGLNDPGDHKTVGANSEVLDEAGVSKQVGQHHDDQGTGISNKTTAVYGSGIGQTRVFDLGTRPSVGIAVNNSGPKSLVSREQGRVEGRGLTKPDQGLVVDSGPKPLRSQEQGPPKIDIANTDVSTAKPLNSHDHGVSKLNGQGAETKLLSSQERTKHEDKGLTKLDQAMAIDSGPKPLRSQEQGPPKIDIANTDVSTAKPLNSHDHGVSKLNGQGAETKLLMSQEQTKGKGSTKLDQAMAVDSGPKPLRSQERRPLEIDIATADVSTAKPLNSHDHGVSKLNGQGVEAKLLTSREQTKHGGKGLTKLDQAMAIDSGPKPLRSQEQGPSKIDIANTDVSTAKPLNSHDQGVSKLNGQGAEAKLLRSQEQTKQEGKGSTELDQAMAIDSDPKPPKSQEQGPLKMAIATVKPLNTHDRGVAKLDGNVAKLTQPDSSPKPLQSREQATSQNRLSSRLKGEVDSGPKPLSSKEQCRSDIETPSQAAQNVQSGPRPLRSQEESAAISGRWITKTFNTLVSAWYDPNRF